MKDSQNKPPQIFISYAREDFETAERLYEDLQHARVKPWMDDKDMLVGEKWQDTIERAIRESKWFCALMSSNSVSKKGYVQKELKMAFGIWDTYPDSEIYLLPVRLDDCEPGEKLRHINYADISTSYTAGLKKILRVVAPDFDYDDRHGAGKDDVKPIQVVKPKYSLREKGREVSPDDFRQVFKLDDNLRPLTYILNEYVDDGDGTITDNATGLMWEKSGSDDWLTYEKAEAYIKKLNDDKFAGHADWRLPTVDELLSLMEKNEQSNDLYIDPIFDSKQRLCWSADTKSSSGGAWFVYFLDGRVYWSRFDDDYYARAVRSRQY